MVALRQILAPVLTTTRATRTAFNRSNYQFPQLLGLQRAYHVAYKVNYDKLRGCTPETLRRPVLETMRSRPAEKILGGIPAGGGRKLDWTQDDYLYECGPRLMTTEVYMPDVTYSQNDLNVGEQVLEPSHARWATMGIMRNQCILALQQRYPVEEEIQARKLCAKTKDDRYPVIFHTLEEQAQKLYVLGRIELERRPEVRLLAWYILTMSAGLGHLEAALLLHQLEKVDPQYVARDAPRAIISNAAEMRLDWRAMVAHCEHIMSTHRSRGTRNVAQPTEEFDECLEYLQEAMSMTVPAGDRVVEAESPPKGHIDADVFEVFDPPYEVLLELTSNRIQAGDDSDRVIELFDRAALVGAFDYGDPEAASRYMRFHADKEDTPDENWLKCAYVAASSGDADACFQLAKYHLKRDGWFTDLAATVMEEYRQKGPEAFQEGDRANEGSALSSETRIHNEIMRRKNVRLLERQEGIEWMKATAQLHVRSATQMLNHYGMLASLLRQNCFLDEGRDILLEAQTELQKSVDPSRNKRKALDIVREYLDAWDERLVHRLLPADDFHHFWNTTRVGNIA